MSSFQIDIHLILNFFEWWRYPWSGWVRRQIPLLPALFMSVLRHFTWNRFLPLWKQSLLYFTHPSNFWIPVFAGFFCQMLCNRAELKSVSWICFLRMYCLIEENRIFTNDFKSSSFHENCTPKWLFTNCSIITFFFFFFKNTSGKPDSIHYQKSLHWFGCIRTSVSSGSSLPERLQWLSPYLSWKITQTRM